ncbi:MAG: hypothetical protein Kow0088_05280 [Anaerolineales bacterium]
MAFQVTDYHDLVRLLQQHPEWREELRHLLLTADVLELPQVVRELVEAHKRSEERLTRLEQAVAELIEAQKRTEQRVEELAEAQKRTEQRVEELAEAQKRSEERLTHLEQTVAELVEAQKRTEQRLAELAEIQQRHEERLTRLEQTVAELVEAQKRTEQRVEELAEAQRKTEEKLQKLTDRVDLISIQVDELRGDMLEMRYRQRAFSYFGKIVSRAQVVDLQEIWLDVVEPRLSTDERDDLLSLDLLIRGQLNRSLMEQTGVGELWLAVEVSGVVDQNDVKRAKRRAELLSKAGLTVLPVAAGREITKGAVNLAGEMGVILQRDGSLLYLEEAIAHLKKPHQE